MRKNVFLLFFMLLIGISCTSIPRNSSPLVRPPTLETPTLSGIKTVSIPTPMLTHTPLDLPTEAPTSTQIPSLTNTPKPKPIQPTKTPLPDQSSEFNNSPSWIVEPETPVLLALTTSNYDDLFISFFNAATGERFDLPAPLHDHISFYSALEWVHNANKLQVELQYLKGDYTYRYQIDVDSGQINQELVNNNYEPNIHIIKSPDEQKSIVINKETKTVTLSGVSMVNDILLPSSFGDSYPDSVTGKWSPDGSYFAILRKLWQYPPDSYSEYALEIYDSYGNTVGLYEDVTSLNWALDGSYRILYSDYKNENTPCILNIIEKNTHCINEFIEWRNAQNVNTESYTWSPDGNEIAFIYWDMQLGGLCTFNIPTTMVTCPTDDWITSESPEMFVREYSKSPDGQYYSIFVDPYGAMGHDLSYIKIGIVSADGRDFEVFDIIYAHNASWRPMLTP